MSLVLAIVGCKGYPNVCDDYSGRTCISLEVDLSSSGPVTIDTIRVTPLSGFTLTQANAKLSLPQGGATPLPILVPILPVTIVGGAVAVNVEGLLQGKVVGHADFTTFLGLGDHDQVTVELTNGSDADMALLPPDMANCDPVVVDACGTGQKCEVTTPQAATTTCVANANEVVSLGNSCTPVPDNCPAGDECDPGFKYCARLCHADSDCPTAAGPLSSRNVPHCGSFCPGCYGAGPPDTYRCTLPCNPVLAAGSSGCVSGSKCDGYWTGGGGGAGTSIEYTDCYTADAAGTDGASCMYSSDCAAGYACVGGSATTSHCRMYCRPANNADCTISGQTCISNSGDITGVCCASTGC